MLYREIIAVRSKTAVEHTKILYIKNVESVDVKLGGI